MRQEAKLKLSYRQKHFSMTSHSFHINAADIFARVGFGPLVDDLARMHRETPADLRDMLLEQPGKMDKDYCLIRAAW